MKIRNTSPFIFHKPDGEKDLKKLANQSLVYVSVGSGASVLTVELRSRNTDGESIFIALFSMGVTRGATDAM